MSILTRGMGGSLITRGLAGLIKYSVHTIYVTLALLYGGATAIAKQRHRATLQLTNDATCAMRSTTHTGKAGILGATLLRSKTKCNTIGGNESATLISKNKKLTLSKI